jgi:putative membrane protein
MMDGWDSGMGVAGWTLMIVFWIALVALIGLAITKLFPSSRDGRPADEAPASESPERLLDTRLARGEIDVETYERLREVLAGRGQGR